MPGMRSEGTTLPLLAQQLLSADFKDITDLGLRLVSRCLTLSGRHAENGIGIPTRTATSATSLSRGGVEVKAAKVAKVAKLAMLATVAKPTPQVATAAKPTSPI